MSAIPTTMKAIITEGTEAVLKADVPVPQLEKNFMLIKTEAVAGNPTDWKHTEFQLSPQGSIIGCDAAGVIVKLGEGVDNNRFAVGDHVYSFIHGSSNYNPKNGAFGEYVAVNQNSTFKASKPLTHSKSDKIPFGTVSTFEAAASIPLSFTTAGASLFHHYKLKMEWEPTKPQVNQATLIWGGATALGQALIQIMKQINAYTDIVVVASKKHEAKLKSLGATDIFDYHDADVIEQITKKYPDLQQLYDAVSNTQTTHQVYQCASKTNTAQVLQYMFMSTKDIDEKVRRDNVSVAATLIYCVGGYDVSLAGMTLPADPTYGKIVGDFVKFIEPRLTTGQIKHIDISIYPNGLKDVPQLLQDIKTGKNSGSKLVATL